MAAKDVRRFVGRVAIGLPALISPGCDSDTEAPNPVVARSVFFNHSPIPITHRWRFPDELISSRNPVTGETKTIDLTDAKAVAKAMGVELSGKPEQVLYEIEPFRKFIEVWDLKEKPTVITVGDLSLGKHYIDTEIAHVEHPVAVLDNLRFSHKLISSRNPVTGETKTIDLTDAKAVAKAMGVELDGSSSQKLYSIGQWLNGHGALPKGDPSGPVDITVGELQKGADIIKRDIARLIDWYDIAGVTRRQREGTTTGASRQSPWV